MQSFLGVEYILEKNLIPKIKPYFSNIVIKIDGTGFGNKQIKNFSKPYCSPHDSPILDTIPITGVNLNDVTCGMPTTGPYGTRAKDNKRIGNATYTTLYAG
ncbi:hypothetical protein [Stygiolobus caldivivus]|uniref:Uncharacterized protein n=1 Tax=Stygiolobus caldivivus TaxID=2824673 RepID=A0A8D5ZKQ2_9CREN|nr:hypothetical protein [Stygiolobus caldivivus]BCU71610.1 hypothetical protein KN1_29070 [Stygiolobus caldivivus]